MLLVFVGVKRIFLILTVCAVSFSFAADDQNRAIAEEEANGQIQVLIDSVQDYPAIGAAESVDAFCARMASAPVLERAMQFPLGDIVARCKKDHNYTDEDMVLLEKEVRRFLYLCVISKDSLGMYSKHVDNLWHTFILFTREYHAFSDLVNGSYIHHNPVRDHERPATQEQKVNACSDYAQFIKTYEATFGEEIHPIWLLDGVVEQEDLVIEKAEEIL